MIQERKKPQKKPTNTLTNTAIENKACDSAESRRPLSPGSSDALTVVIHMAVLTCEQGHGVLLPFPVSHHSGPKVCLDMPFPAPLSPETPSTRLQKNHSSLQVLHFKGPVEGCSSRRCGRRREYVLNFWERMLSAMNQKPFHACQNFC